MPKKKKVMITGVAGFIGSNLAGALLERGYNVIGLDNLSQGFKRNIKELLGDNNFKFVKGDVLSERTVDRLMKGMDYVVHLAAYKIPRYGNAMDTLLINSRGVRTILESARRNKVKVVFASTSDVYGKRPDVPFEEDGDILLGHSKVKRWAYAVSKLFDEHLCFAYEEKYGLKVCVLRFFGGYGPNQNTTWWGGPQSVFIDCALKNKTMTLHGDGKQTRSFTFVGDMVKGIYLAMECPSAYGEILNIGNDREITIKKLAEMIWSMVRGTKPKIKTLSYNKLSKGYQDVMRRIPDTTKSKKLIGFKSKVQLEEALPLTIEWQKGLQK